MAGAAIPVAISIFSALAPHLPTIISTIEKLVGRGNGRSKRAAAISLAKAIPDVAATVTGVEDDDAIGQIVDVGVKILGGAGVINQHQASDTTVLPIAVPPKNETSKVVQLEAEVDPDGTIHIVVPAAHRRRGYQVPF